MIMTTCPIDIRKSMSAPALKNLVPGSAVIPVDIIDFPFSDANHEKCNIMVGLAECPNPKSYVLCHDLALFVFTKGGQMMALNVKADYKVHSVANQSNKNGGTGLKTNCPGDPATTYAYFSNVNTSNEKAAGVSVLYCQDENTHLDPAGNNHKAHHTLMGGPPHPNGNTDDERRQNQGTCMTEHSCCILTIIDDQILQGTILTAASQHLHKITNGNQGTDHGINAESACEIMYNVTQGNWNNTLPELFWKFFDKLIEENFADYGNSHASAMNSIFKQVHNVLSGDPSYRPFGSHPHVHSRVEIEIVQCKNEPACTVPLYNAMPANHTGKSIYDDTTNCTYPSTKKIFPFQIAPADSNANALYAMNILLKTKSS